MLNLLLPSTSSSSWSSDQRNRVGDDARHDTIRYISDRHWYSNGTSLAGQKQQPQRQQLPPPRQRLQGIIGSSDECDPGHQRIAESSPSTQLHTERILYSIIFTRVTYYISITCIALLVFCLLLARRHRSNSSRVQVQTTLMRQQESPSGGPQ
jgi:hypothetical protein